MHEKLPPPWVEGGSTRQILAHRTWALAWLIILSSAAEVESTVIAKRDVARVMSWKEKKTKTNRNPGGRGGKKRAKK